MQCDGDGHIAVRDRGRQMYAFDRDRIRRMDPDVAINAAPVRVKVETAFEIALGAASIRDANRANIRAIESDEGRDVDSKAGAISVVVARFVSVDPDGGS